jgi:hypothetical protein
LRAVTELKQQRTVRGCVMGLGSYVPLAATTEKSAQPTERHAPHCTPKTSVLTPLPTYLFRLVLARSRCPSVSQASHFLAHLALLVPPEALCSPATTSPKFSKRCPYGARLAPATGGARHFLGGRRSAAPAEKLARPGKRFQPAPRPALSIAGGKSRLAKPQHYAWQT